MDDIRVFDNSHESLSQKHQSNFKHHLPHYSFLSDTQSLSEHPIDYNKITLNDSISLQNLYSENDITVDIITDIAYTHGLLNRLKFENEGLRSVATLIEFRLLQVIQQAKKFLIHSARPSNHEILTSKDIKSALHTLKMEPIYGYSKNWQYQFIGMKGFTKNEMLYKRELSFNDFSYTNNMTSNANSSILTSTSQNISSSSSFSTSLSSSINNNYNINNNNNNSSHIISSTSHSTSDNYLSSFNSTSSPSLGLSFSQYENKQQNMFNKPISSSNAIKYSLLNNIPFNQKDSNNENNNSTHNNIFNNNINNSSNTIINNFNNNINNSSNTIINNFNNNNNNNVNINKMNKNFPINRNNAQQHQLDNGKVRLVRLIYQDLKVSIPCEPALSIHWLSIQGEIPISSFNLTVHTPINNTHSNSLKSYLQITDNADEAYNSNYTQQIHPHFTSDKPLSKMMLMSQFDYNKSNTTSQLNINKEMVLHNEIDTNNKTHREINDSTINNNVELIPLKNDNDTEQNENNNKYQLNLVQPSQSLITTVNDISAHQMNTVTDLNAFIIANKIPHLLGVEQHFFLCEIKDTVRATIHKKGHDFYKRFHRALEILRSSEGLDQLLPFLLQFFATEVDQLYKNSMFFGVSIMLLFIESLIQNPHIRFHNYIHQILAPLLNIILNSDDNMTMLFYYGFHLRREAASVLGNLASLMRFSKGIVDTLDDTLLQIFKKCLLNPDASLQMCFGAIEGIRALGSRAMQLLLIPILPYIFKIITFSQSITIMEIEAIPLTNKNTESQRILALKQFLLSEIETSLLACICEIILVQFSHDNFNILNPLTSHSADIILWKTLNSDLCYLDDHFIPIILATLHKSKRLIYRQEIDTFIPNYQINNNSITNEIFSNNDSDTWFLPNHLISLLTYTI